jgi:hypothetical protein
MNGFRLLAFGGIPLLLSACAPEICTTSDFERLKPRSVLVLPPENTTANTDVLEKSYPFLFSELAQRGYYAVSPELALQLFQANKMEDPGRLNKLPTGKFNEVFGVDAVLRTKVTEWSSKYIVVSSTVNVGFDMELLDARTGTLLWKDSKVLSQAPNNNPGGGLVGALVGAALNAAVTPYEPVADQNAKNMFATIPQGSVNVVTP